ncbi:hypothetical protein M501DRAFT_988514 [Patellaria atrata CBS 101060]|uniref:Pentatricopeptide repeat protein n=1 Tax=Patellaria atrata CBS 101060 TaxID=1346257 RepID=A0A9P4SI70_9PEZI|nr:hypothetical protein M501DRAFT_988514 [Patellaria atrata CBS 101060]
MQSLWSRTAQARSACGCPSCLATASAIARCSSLANAKRLFQLNSSSTIFYSTIFAAAAVADASAKQKRRSQWDRAITTARRELDQLRARSDLAVASNGEVALLEVGDEGSSQLEQARDSNINDEEELRTGLSEPGEREHGQLHSNHGDVTAQSHWKYAEEPVIPRLDDGEQVPLSKATGFTIRTYRFMKTTTKNVEKKSAYPTNESEPISNKSDLSQYSLLPGARRPKWPANTGPTLNARHLPPQSLWSTDEARRKALEHRYTPKKLRLTGLIVMRLVLVLFLYARIHDFSPRHASDLPITVKALACKSREQLLDLLLEVQSETDYCRSTSVADDAGEGRILSVPIPRYHQDDDGVFHMVTADMNNSIMNICEKHHHKKGMTFKDLIIFLSDLLLDSSSPPNVSTWNALISWFARWGRGGIVDALVSSIIDGYVRPNEYTCAATLTHYTRRNDAKSFVDFVARMRGAGFKHLMLARPNIAITDAGRSRLLLIPGTSKIIQKVYPTPTVFNALMGGVLQFAGFERAVEIAAEMREDGWGLDIPGLTLLIRDCVKRRDWNSGYAVWKQLLKVARMSDGRKPVDVVAYHTMIQLCNVCEKDDNAEKIYKDAEERGITRNRINSIHRKIPVATQSAEDNVPALENPEIVAAGIENLAPKFRKWGTVYENTSKIYFFNQEANHDSTVEAKVSDITDRENNNEAEAPETSELNNDDDHRVSMNNRPPSISNMPGHLLSHSNQLPTVTVSPGAA